MAGRSHWKGYVKLSLATCPVQMMPATGDGEKLRLRTLNRATGNRATGNPVASRSVDAGTGAVVEAGETVRGYPRGEDDCSMPEEEGLDAVALDSARTSDIATFVDAGSIAWVWYDRPCHLLPSDPVGDDGLCRDPRRDGGDGQGGDGQRGGAAGDGRAGAGGAAVAPPRRDRDVDLALWRRGAGERGIRGKGGRGQGGGGVARHGLQADRRRDERLVARSCAREFAGADRGEEGQEEAACGEDGRGGQGRECDEHHGCLEAEPRGGDEAPRGAAAPRGAFGPAPLRVFGQR